MTSFDLNYLLKTPFPNPVAFQGEFGGSVQNGGRPALLTLVLSRCTPRGMMCPLWGHGATRCCWWEQRQVWQME